MKNILIFLFFPVFIFGQSGDCGVNSIVFSSYDYIINDTFNIPVTINYTGNADSVNVTLTNTIYEFSDVTWILDNQNDTITHEFTFFLEAVCGRPNRRILYTIDLYGDSCTSNTTYTGEHLFITPGCPVKTSDFFVPVCQSDLNLTGLAEDGGVYVANDSITTKQTLKKNNWIYETLTLIIRDSFYSMPGVDFFVDLKGCN